MPKLRRLPQEKDKLLHVESGVRFIVVRRLSENRLIVRREDGLEVDFGYAPYGYPADHTLLNEVLWLIRHNIFKFEGAS